MILFTSFLSLFLDDDNCGNSLHATTIKLNVTVNIFSSNVFAFVTRNSQQKSHQTDYESNKLFFPLSSRRHLSASRRAQMKKKLEAFSAKNVQLRFKTLPTHCIAFMHIFCVSFLARLRKKSTI